MLDIKSLTGAYIMTSLVRNRISKSKDICNSSRETKLRKTIGSFNKSNYFCKPYHVVWFINYE